MGRSVGDKIKELRQKYGLSQTKLAEIAELSPAAISQFEKGVRKPSFEAIQKLANALNVSADYFLDRENKSLDEVQMMFRGFKNLSEEDQKKILEYYWFLVNKERK